MRVCVRAVAHRVTTFLLCNFFCKRDLLTKTELSFLCMGLPYSTQRVLDSVEVDCGKCFHHFQMQKTILICKNGDACFNNVEWAAEFGVGDADDAYGTSQYVLDSGATVHCFNDLTLFHSLDHNAHLPKLRVANGDFSQVVAVGTVRIQLKDTKGKPKWLELKGALYVPTLKFNLISVKRMYRDSRITTIFTDIATLRFKDGTFISCKGRKNGKHYFLSSLPSEQAFSMTTECDFDLLHQRFAHCNDDRLKKAATRSIGVDLSKFLADKRHICEGCKLGRSRKKPFKVSQLGKQRFTYFGQRIHSDVCGPFPCSVGDGYTYLACFIDCYSNYACVYPMVANDAEELLRCFQAFISEHKSILQDGKIHEFYSDNGGEYLNADVELFCDEVCNIRRLSTPYCPPQNAIAERLWGILLGPMRAYFAASDVPQDFWPYAADHVCKLHNMLPSRSLDNEISPYEQVFKRKPDLSRFKVWGCKCYFHLNDRDRLLLDSTKLDGTAVKAVHLGYDEQRLRAYHVYVPSLNRITTASILMRNSSLTYAMNCKGGTMRQN